MTSPPSSSESAFSKFHPGIQRWIWDQGWTELRSAQVEAAAPILAGDQDVIISAATAAGKTEAAFLPILSALASQPSLVPGVEVLCISPLKALINDQFERLTPLAERVDVQVHPWHGVVGGGKKAAVLRKPSGLLLITPESLEALFVLRGAEMPELFQALRFVVVDELHSFMGTERGAQLQSLLQRTELAIRRRVPRIALSATLGDMDVAAAFLRPAGGASVQLVIADDDGQALKIQLRGYIVGANSALTPATAASPDELEIASDLFHVLRGSDNLIFANTRRSVEIYADLLRGLSDEERVPNEFFAHHGSLSKDAREFVEKRLKDQSLPANAVCTSTLEMGIDIGDVRSIAQIGAPPAVASMRQRLGRSGRRGDAAILRLYVTEDEVTSKTPPPDLLRGEIVQSIAMVNLLLERWYEPPDPDDLHLSTMIQQTLSIIAQHGGVLARDLYSILCTAGPFSRVSEGQFTELLRHLGSKDVIMQSPDGTLLLGTTGERIVNHFTFYAAFATPEEWRLVSGGHALGSVPLLFPMKTGLLLIFSGRRWRVVSVDREHKVVDLIPAPGGRPPRFSGAGALVHPKVRGEMHSVYGEANIPTFLDATAGELLTEGRQNFMRLGLNEKRFVETGGGVYLFPWTGDRILNTVIALLSHCDTPASVEGAAIFVPSATASEVITVFEQLLAGAMPDAFDLAQGIENKASEKWDQLLTEGLLDLSYAAKSLDIVGAREVISRMAREG
jgi:ATP-dependent Lhr-like helicase